MTHDTPTLERMIELDRQTALLDAMGFAPTAALFHARANRLRREQPAPAIVEPRTTIGVYKGAA